MNTPIIFIPGIEGTSLADTNTFDYNLVWNSYNSVGGAITTSVLGVNFTEKLQDNGDYDLEPLQIIERNHILNYPYQNAINYINAQTQQPVYLFGYDWRKSCISNGMRLTTYVEYLKRKLNCTAFDFITHSMGGLVFSSYLNQLRADYSSINKAILTVPPFRGSDLAIKHITVGNSGVKGLLNCDEDSRKANRTFPGLFELCPWYNNAVVDENGNNVDLSDMNNWQENVYDDDPTLFKMRLDGMKNFQKNGMLDLSGLPDTVKERLIIIVGTKDATLLKINRLDEFNGTKCFFDFKNVTEDIGDGTVPFVSSSIYCKSITTFSIEKPTILGGGLISVSFHALFLNDSRVKNIIKNFLTGNTEASDWYTSIGGPTEVQRVCN